MTTRSARRRACRSHPHLRVVSSLEEHDLDVREILGEQRRRPRRVELDLFELGVYVVVVSLLAWWIAGGRP